MPGVQPVTARFRGFTHTFPTAKEAYVWMLQHFIQAQPDLLERDSEIGSAAKGRGRVHFGRGPRDLFPASPRLSENSNFYAKLPGGWYAITNINNKEKLDKLTKLAGLAKLTFKRDWDWNIDAPAKPLKF